MNEKVQARDEISLAEIFKALLKKWKLLVITLLCAVFVGAGFGVVTTMNTEYYGTKIDFYVNPRLDKNSSTENNSQYGVYGAYGLHVMDNMITLLSSELFAERLTLDVNGLPERRDGNDALNAAIEAAEEAQEAVANATTAIETAEDAIEAAQKALTAANNAKKVATNEQSSAQAKYNLLTEQLYTAWNQLNVADKPNEPAAGYSDTIDRLMEERAAANTNLTTANATLTQKTEAVFAAEEALADANLALKDREKESVQALDDEEIAREAAIAEWQKTDEYEALMTIVKKSVGYSYYNEGEEEDVQDLARSFIYIRISVLNNKDFADWLYNKVITIVPLFVEENMAVPSGYDGTNCRRITRNDQIERTNKNYTMSTAIKYAVLLGAVAFVIACVAVIVVDRSDKRLRDYEQTMEVFGVPVLGVIPTMKEKKSDKEVA